MDAIPASFRRVYCGIHGVYLEEGPAAILVVAGARTASSLVLGAVTVSVVARKKTDHQACLARATASTLAAIVGLGLALAALAAATSREAARGLILERRARPAMPRLLAASGALTFVEALAGTWVCWVAWAPRVDGCRDREAVLLVFSATALALLAVYVWAFAVRWDPGGRGTREGIRCGPLLELPLRRGASAVAIARRCDRRATASNAGVDARERHQSVQVSAAAWLS